jgi:monoamine oxidase
VIVMAGGVIEYFDVLIVGAGISGIGGAYHLTKQCPGTSFVVLEAQESFGGTHRYPGIRSDSDLYTFGYRFKPWTSAEIDQDAVAHELRDKTVVAPDRGTAPVLKRRDDIAQIFRVHPGRECRRPDQVAEHHGQLAALGLGLNRR